MQKLTNLFKKKNEEVKNLMNEEHEGAVAFEYIIILVIMAVCIFTAWKILSDQVIKKAGEIAKFIQNNGQDGLGTVSGS